MEGKKIKCHYKSWLAFLARKQDGIAVGEIADIAVTPWKLCNMVLSDRAAGEQKLPDRSPTKVLSQEYLDIIEGSIAPKGFLIISRKFVNIIEKPYLDLSNVI